MLQTLSGCLYALTELARFYFVSELFGYVAENSVSDILTDFFEDVFVLVDLRADC